MHSWGDGFDFDELYRAEKFICDYVSANSDYYLVSKEKYGTIRYEHVIPKDRQNNDWDTPDAWKVVQAGIFEAILLWPHLKVELTRDFDDWIS